MKRANGTGSIVKLSGKRRKPFVVRVSGHDEHGHIIQRPLSYHATSKEAQAALDEFNRQRAAGEAISVSRMDTTLQAVFDGWFDRASRKLNDSSIRSHNAAWRKRVSRYKERKMRDISLDDWQAILDEDEDAGRSQSLINNDVILIRALCSYAMERDIIGKDYSAFLDIPSVGAIKEKGAFNDLQLAKLEQLAAGGFPWADTALMLCYTGFRITEFLSLTHFSYDVKGDYLQGGMKTEAGRNRIVPVHPKIKPYLNAWLDKGGQRIICWPDSSPIESQQYRAQLFPPIADALDAPAATPHWCRHTFATRLHAAGADELSIKWLLGHSVKGDVTAGYTHATLDVLEGAIRLLA
ncbi:MAG: site-specific integrase [Intestinimonas sp.]|nr:site-specific integrase [Intestinimonas sp.]